MKARLFCVVCVVVAAGTALPVAADVGVERFQAIYHAVLTDSNPDFDSGKVTEVLQKGYKLNGKVIRPSMVKVNE